VLLAAVLPLTRIAVTPEYDGPTSDLDAQTLAKAAIYWYNFVWFHRLVRVSGAGSRRDGSGVVDCRAAAIKISSFEHQCLRNAVV
jgi:hypothetical protein